MHSHAWLAQCRERLRSLGLQPVIHPDTAGAAKDIAARGDKKVGAIASALAGEIYDLDVLIASAEDAEQNTTRFLIMARDPQTPNPNDEAMLTTMVFRLRSVPRRCTRRLAASPPMASISPNWKACGPARRPRTILDVEGHTDHRRQTCDEAPLLLRGGRGQIMAATGKPHKSARTDTTIKTGLARNATLITMRDNLLVRNPALFHISVRKAGWTCHPPIRSGPKGSSRSGLFMGRPVFR